MLDHQQEQSTISPRLVPGSTVYTGWGDPVTIDSIIVDTIITYTTTDGNFWQADELYHQQPVEHACERCGQLNMFPDTLTEQLLVCNSCKKG